MLIKRYKDILPYNWRTVKIPVENPKPGEDHNKFVKMVQPKYKQKADKTQ